MRVSEKQFNEMPTHLKALFAKSPNPSKDEVVGAFPNTRARGNITPTKSKGAIFGSCGEHEGPIDAGDSGSAARFYYSAKASKADRAGSKHPTVKPIALMQWLARLITPPGGTVLDPFAGSGTTGAACEREGFSVILCEREDEYVGDIRRRLDPNATPEPTPTPCPPRLLRLLAWNANVEAYLHRQRAAHV